MACGLPEVRGIGSDRSKRTVSRCLCTTHVTMPGKWLLLFQFASASVRRSRSWGYSRRALGLGVRVLAVAQASVVATRNPGQIFDVAPRDPNAASSLASAA